MWREIVYKERRKEIQERKKLCGFSIGDLAEDQLVSSHWLVERLEVLLGRM